MQRIVQFTILSLFLLSGFVLHAQTNKINADFYGTFASRYLLRGNLYTQTPVMQPMIGISRKNLAFYLEGVYSFTKDEYQETNLYLTWAKENVSLTLADYFGYMNNNTQGNYFDWNSHATSHIVEVLLELQNMCETSIDMKTTCMIYGADKNINGNNRYTMYYQLSRSFKNDMFNYNVFLGLTPFEGGYADDFAITNVGVNFEKEVKITDSLKPNMFLTFCANPYRNNVIFVCGLKL